MRLIDADAFKEYIKEFEDDYENAYIICEYIDNAPTVDLTNMKLYSRPQGAWSTTDETDEFYGGVYKCTHCGEETLACSCHNFCTWCGASMEVKKNDTVQNTD